jgi:hypothetical protein
MLFSSEGLQPHVKPDDVKQHDACTACHWRQLLWAGRLGRSARPVEVREVNGQATTGDVWDRCSDMHIDVIAACAIFLKSASLKQFPAYFRPPSPGAIPFSCK